MAGRFSEEFEDRLKYYGIDSINKEKIVIDHSIEWTDESAPFEVNKITIEDLDEVKRLIGNADKLFEEGALKPSNHMDAVQGLKEVTVETVRQAASAYVYGNSQPLRHLKGQIEKLIGTVPIHVAGADEIIISEPLTIPPGAVKLLQANKITFTGNGQITNLGVLSLNAQRIVNAKS